MIDRIRELAIPPAWEDVWICPYPIGHIQATGHRRRGPQAVPLPRPLARAARPREVRVDDPASPARCPRLRERVAERPRPRRACRASRCSPARSALLDRGFFRIGSEDYAEENDTYGIATMQKRHVTVRDDGSLRLRGQGRPAPRCSDRRPRGRRRGRQLKRRRAAAARSCWPTSSGRRWVRREVRGHQRLRQGGRRRGLHRQGLPHLERHGAGGGRARRVGAGAARQDGSRKRAKTRAIKEVAHYLGNTPAVAAQLLHRPARVRPLRRRPHDRRRAARAGRRRGGLARPAGRDRGGRARPDRARTRELRRDREGAASSRTSSRRWRLSPGAPNSVAYVAAGAAAHGRVDSATPMPISRNEPLRMFARWPGLFIHMRR